MIANYSFVYDAYVYLLRMTPAFIWIVVVGKLDPNNMDKDIMRICSYTVLSQRLNTDAHLK